MKGHALDPGFVRSGFESATGGWLGCGVRLVAPSEEAAMPYVRVADFDADDAAIDGFVAMVNADPDPPEGVPATGINVLAKRDKGRMRVVVFDSEEDLRKGSETLDSMSPREDLSLRRTNVETFELLVQMQA